MTLIIILITYLIATLWEYYLHKEILHANNKKVKKWKHSQNVISRLLYKGYFSHHTVHHQKTFQKEYHIQFDSDEQQIKLNIYLIKKFGETNDKQNYGLTINTFWEYVMFMLPWFIVAPIALYIETYFLILCTLILMLPLLLSKFIHPILHEDKIQKSWIFNNAYIKKIYQTHRIHHEDDTKNFNLLLGADWLMGSYQRPL